MPALAPAQNYPTRPLRMIIGFPPGGPTDLIARLVGQHLFETFAQPVVIDNRPGAGGAVAGLLMVKAAPDGHTLFIASNGEIAISPNLYKKMTYDTVRDIAPVSRIGGAQLVLLPVYLALMLGGSSEVAISITPFLEAFVLLIVLPMALAVLTSAGARRSRAIATWNDAWAWLPVPAMALVLMVVIASQIAVVLRDFDRLLPVVPVYIGFMLLAPVLGFICARLLRLPASEARSVTFSAATRNSLVVLPLALALPEEMRGLAAAAVITQTLVELVSELIYVRAVPRFVR